MLISQATLSDLNVIKNISEVTISEIYPHYYSSGAVEFFLNHHSENAILKDIEMGCVFICFDVQHNAIGTITIKGNEICRLFVLPSYQGMGYGGKLLDFAEETIISQYPKIVLDASLPAKGLYLKRGYEITEFHTIAANNNDFLCYDVMERKL